MLMVGMAISESWRRDDGEIISDNRRYVKTEWVSFCFPTMRAISRCDVLRSSSVSMVARWLDFKTFTPWPSLEEDRINVLPTGADGAGV